MVLHDAAKHICFSLSQARKVLEKVRGTKDVDEEYNNILEKAQLAAQIKNPWTLLLFRKKYRWGRCSSGLYHLCLGLVAVGTLDSSVTDMQAAAGVCGMLHAVPTVDGHQHCELV